ncbi:MAG TPA: glycoside hydrolase family 125 protein [Actinospica sp.]|nr:glycoside hydrolase family 125 protein [Actinospica sp.]
MSSEPPILPALHERVAAAVGDEAAMLVERFVSETMNRAARRLADGTLFLVTGDIPAMWLRDSAAQVLPLLRLGAYCPAAEEFVAGVLRRQLSCIVLDPYANAFNAGPDGAGHQRDRTAMSPHVWERKYEVDSLCYPLHLAERFWRSTGRTDILDGLFWRAVERVIELWEVEQDHENRSPYRFRRRFARSNGTLGRRGKGKPVAVTGLTWSGFRPSDDACGYGYNVPGNMFASSVLARLPQAAEAAPPPAPVPAPAPAPPQNGGLIGRATRLRAAIEQGLREYAIVEDPVTGPWWAYEVDGLGGVLEMDDANVPSLLSLPRLGYCRADEPLYQATRAFVLSPRNPHYHRGTAAAGIGSPHTPRRHVWPIALATAALTDPDEAARRAAVATLLRTRGGTDRIHESFHVDHPEKWTRGWFSWAEATFCDLVLDCAGFPVPD